MLLSTNKVNSISNLNNRQEYLSINKIKAEQWFHCSAFFIWATKRHFNTTRYKNQSSSSMYFTVGSGFGQYASIS